VSALAPPRMCFSCGVNRAAWTAPRVDYCYDCLPGGPIAAPLCRSCGSSEYFSQGLCARCHPGSPQYPGACKDCLAWGVFRMHNWKCWVCRGHSAHNPPGHCPYCLREVPVGRSGACRLCWEQAEACREPGAALDLAEANRHGQQLFLANVPRPRRAPVPSATATAATAPRTVGDAFAPVRYKQYPLFHLPRGTIRVQGRLPAAPSPAMNEFCGSMLAEHARAHGWRFYQIDDVKRALAVLQHLQATPGAKFTASDLEVLAEHELPVERTLDVLEAAGLLEDDRIPALRRYFQAHAADLPEPMRAQLEFWYAVMTEGITSPPRRRPRHAATVHHHIRWMNPALIQWTAAGHTSLAEISREELVAALPEPGTARTVQLQAWRSTFSILKGHKKIFTNPAAGIRPGKVGSNVPLPLETAKVRDALNHPDPAVALAVSLVVFHALTAAQVRTLSLCDVADHRLTLDGRLIPLAGPVRTRLAAYLDHRARAWPESANPYLIVSRRTAGRLSAPGRNYPWIMLELRPQALREDRLLAETHATGGDIKRICDLFGMSVAGATRYTTTIEHPDLRSAPETTLL